MWKICYEDENGNACDWGKILNAETKEEAEAELLWWQEQGQCLDGFVMWVYGG